MPRSAAEAIRIESRRRKVAELYLHGMRSLTRIARELGLDKAQISRDFKHIRKMWQEGCIQDLQVALQEEIAKIDEIEQKAWLAWERSCKAAEIMEITGTARGGKSKPEKVRKLTKEQSGNARFLKVALECVNKRSNLRGLFNLELWEKMQALQKRVEEMGLLENNGSMGKSTFGWRT